MKMLWETVRSLAEAHVDNVHCSPFIYPDCHALIEGCKIHQTQFPLGGSMLNTPDNLLFPHMLEDDINNEFYHFSRGCGEAD